MASTSAREAWESEREGGRSPVLYATVSVWPKSRARRICWCSAGRAGDIVGGRRDEALELLRQRRRLERVEQVGDALRICLGHLSVEAIADFVQPPERKAWLELVMAWLSSAIDHLKRPVDAIKHQAKTVTVGISREEAKLPLDTPLIKALADAEVAVEHFDEATAATLAAAAPYVREVLGCTTYAVSGLSPLGRPGPGSTLKVVRKTGCAAGMASRADAGAPLTGTKRMVVSAPRVTFGRGVSDGRCLVIAPLFEAGRVSGLGLLHVAFRDDLDPRERAQALRLAGRFEDVRALVTEQGRRWQNTLLMSLAVEDLLTLAPAALASAMPEREAT